MKEIKNRNDETSGVGKCPLYRRCGGCQIQNMNYEEQLRWKQNKVNWLLNKYHDVNTIIGMKKPYNYRNKVQAAFRINQSKKIISGVYQSGTNTVVPVDYCMIEDKKADEIIITIRKLLKSFKLMPYDIRSRSGFLRHVLIKRGFTSGQIMVVLVTGTPVFPSKNSFIKELLRLHPDITTILMNVSKFETELLLSTNEKVLYGKGYIEDTLCGHVFRISSKSFYQINPVQTEVLYKKAIEYAGLTGKETVIDAYCGIGTIGIIASKYAKQVYGVESNREAFKDAINNAKINNCDNIRFINYDAGKYMTELAEEKIPVDIVFMDPPRAGSDERFLSSVITLLPEKIIYVSCNPETLERDLKYLTSNGYKVEEIQPVDMFPHTSHVETIIMMTKCGSEGKNRL